MTIFRLFLGTIVCLMLNGSNTCYETYHVLPIFLQSNAGFYVSYFMLPLSWIIYNPSTNQSGHTPGASSPLAYDAEPEDLPGKSIYRSLSIPSTSRHDLSNSEVMISVGVPLATSTQGRGLLQKQPSEEGRLLGSVLHACIAGIGVHGVCLESLVELSPAWHKFIPAESHDSTYEPISRGITPPFRATISVNVSQAWSKKGSTGDLKILLKRYWRRHILVLSEFILP